jgi:hypothetical protein
LVLTIALVRAGPCLSLCAHQLHALHQVPLPFLSTTIHYPLTTLPQAGRCRRLPAHTPLRTVLESFPSYGLSFIRPDLSWPTRCPTVEQLGNTHRQPLCLCFAATAPGRINQRVLVVICFLRFDAVQLGFLPFQTRPTWAYPAHYRWPWLFSSSQCCAP